MHIAFVLLFGMWRNRWLTYDGGMASLLKPSCMLLGRGRGGGAHAYGTQARGTHTYGT